MLISRALHENEHAFKQILSKRNKQKQIEVPDKYCTNNSRRSLSFRRRREEKETESAALGLTTFSVGSETIFR